MFGVVLWHDEQKRKAVIWCEDHGDLAFCRNTGPTSQDGLDAGDWVWFDLTMGHRQRYAHNLRLIHEGAYAGLGEALPSTSVPAHHATATSNPGQAAPDRASAKIIPFAAPQEKCRTKRHDRSADAGQSARPPAIRSAYHLRPAR